MIVELDFFYINNTITKIAIKSSLTYLGDVSTGNDDNIRGSGRCEGEGRFEAEELFVGVRSKRNSVTSTMKEIVQNNKFSEFNIFTW